MTARRAALAAGLALTLWVAASPPEAKANPSALDGEIAFPTGDLSPEAPGIRKTLEVYVRAVTAKDVELFRQVKPTLSGEEERRVRTAFKSVQSQVVRMNVLSLDVRDGRATVKVARRDTLNGTIVSSFPQTFEMTKGPTGWFIQDIGR